MYPIGFYIKDSLFNICLAIYTVIISNVTIYPTYTRIQLIFTSQDIPKFMTLSLEIHLLIFNFGVSHLRIRTNFYIPFCIKLIFDIHSPFNEKKKIVKMITVLLLLFSIAAVSICQKVFILYLSEHIGRYDICSISICSMAICSSAICSINHLLYSS